MRNPGCPRARTFEAERPASICIIVLDQGSKRARMRKIMRARTWHVLVRAGFSALDAVVGRRGPRLTNAQGIDASVAGLSCPGQPGDAKLVLEIPNYTINYAKAAPH